MHFTLYFAPAVDGKINAKLPNDRQDEGLNDSVPRKYGWDESTGWIARGDQDRCAQESQGPILDRTTEHLGVSDEGVILLRRLFKQAIDAVKNGQDPVGVINHGQYWRRLRGHVELARQGRSVGGIARHVAGQYRLFSARCAQKYRPSQLGEIVYRVHGRERSPGRSTKT